MVSGALVATGVVVTVNVAEDAPAATVTVAGNWAAAGLLLDSATTAPPVGAGLVRVSEPLTDVPPITEVGFTAMVLSLDDVTVNETVLVEP